MMIWAMVTVLLWSEKYCLCHDAHHEACNHLSGLLTHKLPRNRAIKKPASRAAGKEAIEVDFQYYIIIVKTSKYVIKCLVTTFFATIAAPSH